MNLNKSWPLALSGHPFLWVLRFSTASFTPSEASSPIPAFPSFSTGILDLGVCAHVYTQLICVAHPMSFGPCAYSSWWGGRGRWGAPWLTRP